MRICTPWRVLIVVGQPKNAFEPCFTWGLPLHCDHGQDNSAFPRVSLGKDWYRLLFIGNAGGMNGSAETYASVKQYYGAVLQKTTDLKTSACTAGKLLSFLGILLSYLSNITVKSCFVQRAGHMQRFEK